MELLDLLFIAFVIWLGFQMNGDGDGGKRSRMPMLG
jgi:hypothetical protein